MPVDDVLAAASLPEVTVDTEGALVRTRRVGGQRRRRRSVLVGAGAVLVVLTGAVAGRELVGTDDGDRVVTGSDPAPSTPVPAPEPTSTTTTMRPDGTTIATPGTTSTTAATSTPTPTPTDGALPVGPPPDLDACTRESVAAAVGYRADEVLSDPVCHEGWGWIDACTDEESDPVDGCIHIGKIIRVVGGRWIVVTALLQDCAESFTQAGAPPEVAERFYPRCFPDEQG